MKSFLTASVTTLALAKSVQGFSQVPSFKVDRSAVSHFAVENNLTEQESKIDSTLGLETTASESDVEKPKSKPVVTKKKKANPAHKEGIFSPIVKVAKDVVGEKEINSIRGKFISAHSGVIKDFVATHPSSIGERAIRDMFTIADIDGDGEISKEELKVAVSKIGFTWLGDKQIDGIFKRADLNGDGVIDFEEFKKETPKILKTNLVKLAKKNGDEMGWLV